jgi:hypothetical protein
MSDKGGKRALPNLKNSMPNKLAAPFFALLLGCASGEIDSVGRLSISKAARSQGPASVEGWVGFPGNVPTSEVQISSTPKALIQDHDYDPRPCLTAVVSPATLALLQRYDGQRVEMSGHLVRYDSLPLKPVGILEDRFYGNQRISNWCYSRSILIVEDVQAAS